MVRHWLKVRHEREHSRRWRRSIVINAVGATATFVVLLVVIYTKFVHGAWIVIAAMPVIVMGFYGVHRHYGSVSAQLRRGRVSIAEPGRNIVVLYVEELNAATAEAVGYARSFAGKSFRAIHVAKDSAGDAVARDWKAFSRTDVDLEVLLEDRSLSRSIVGYIRSIERDENDFVTVVIPELLPKRSLVAATRSRSFLLKWRLLREAQVVVTDVPVLERGGLPVGVDARPLIPTRVEAVVFVASVHDAALRALNYARSLQAADTRAVFFSMDPRDAEQIQREWAESRIPVALEIAEAPFRDLGPPILEEVRRITAKGDAVAAVIVPELVVKKRWHNLLHNQRPLFIKRLLLFEPRVILSSVPYQLT
jgi:hypothetical protein